MPVNTASIQSGLANLVTNPPATAAEAAQGWANAIGGGFTTIIPASTTVAVAQTALQSALAAAFANNQASCAPQIETAMTAFGAAVAGGMAGAGFAGVPPAGPVGFADVFATTKSDSTSGPAAIAAKLQAWALTGTATTLAPPGTTVPWS